MSWRAATTSELSREHQISYSAAGLISIAGGKWMTYRRMAEDALDFAVGRGMLAAARCLTRTLRIHGAADGGTHKVLDEYESDGAQIDALAAKNAGLVQRIDRDLPYTWAQFHPWSRSLTTLRA